MSLDSHVSPDNGKTLADTNHQHSVDAVDGDQDSDIESVSENDEQAQGSDSDDPLHLEAFSDSNSDDDTDIINQIFESCSGMIIPQTMNRTPKIMPLNPVG